MRATLPSLHEPVQVGPLALPGELCVPDQAIALVLFAHGIGSGRNSERNRRVADVLLRHGLSTLLFDLLTQAEAEDLRCAFDVPLLSGRVEQALCWGELRADVGRLPMGLFGASTGAAAALAAAAARPGRVAAIVTRGGRPDLAADCLRRVEAPTLLIVGSDDLAALELNRVALRQLRCNKRLEVVPGAGHLFEEPGALDSVAELAGAWFASHLVRRRFG